MGGKYKGKEKEREKGRRFYRNHRKEELGRQKEYVKNNKEKHKKAQENWRKRVKKEAVELIGDKCFFCGHKTIVFHEKNGVRHSGRNTALLVTRNPEKFVSLCFPHHRAVHFCMEFLNMSWTVIQRRFEKGG